MSTEPTSTLPTPASGDDLLALSDAVGVTVDGSQDDELIAQAPIAAAGEPVVRPARNRARLALIGIVTAVLGVLAVLAVVQGHERSQQQAGDKAAATAFLSSRGGKVDSIDCRPGHCTALINGTPYTVVIQTDDDGTRHIGVAAYTGR